jgi:glycosyltransferase involved in cell wall biosynthesis
MATTKGTLGVVGNLCNLGHEFARRLSEVGMPARLVVPSTGLDEWRRVYPDVDPADDPHLDVVDGPAGVRKARAIGALRRYDGLLSVCLGGLPVLPVVGRPYISYATGSDLRELAMGLDGAPRARAAAARETFRRARLVFHAPDRTHLDALDALQITRRAPCRHFVDVDFWSEAPPLEPSDRLIVFSPASHTWRPMFEGQGLKRNDLLLRGFAEFIAGGGTGELRYLRRGADIDASEALIDELGLREHVTCVGTELSPSQVRDEMARAHVVADQFGIGSFGLIGLEAMAAGRPVIVNFSPAMSAIGYPEPDDRPPVEFADDPGSIAAALDRLSDPATLADVSARARAWARRVYDPTTVARWYRDLIGDTFGW